MKKIAGIIALIIGIIAVIPIDGVPIGILILKPILIGIATIAENYPK